jgi:small conductance mechanosensitive channel
MANCPDCKAAVLVTWLFLGLSCNGIAFSSLAGQDQSAKSDETKEADRPPVKPPAPPTASKVDVEPAVTDSQIANRLERILKATEWFHNPRVVVDQGVVFLRGSTSRAEYRDWAANLATKTQDVVAVVNRVEVTEPPTWDLSPAWAELRQMSRKLVQSLPLFVLAVIVLFVTYLAAFSTRKAADHLLRRRMPNALLRQVAVRASIAPVWILGTYLILRLSGLTQMALTILGGTGLAGLIIGIAFQNIAENFLASILISVQRPFQANDFIEVAGHQGLVHRVTARGTVLVTLDGNHVQVPNAIIYKSVIRNYSANPNSRLDFALGLDYGSPTSKAQELIINTLQEHPAVLKSPEPLVLVEELTSSGVKLRAFFWINAREHDGGKTKSSLLRLVKKALHDSSIYLPDSSREVVFPKPVPVQMIDAGSVPTNAAHEGNGHDAEGGDRHKNAEPGRVTCVAEGQMRSDEKAIKEQAAASRELESGPDLLTGNGRRE